MSDFIKSLAPTINAAKDQAIAQHIESMHMDFTLLAELTKGAKSYEEIALRFVEKGLIDTYEPSQSVIQFQNLCEEFIEAVAPLLWMQERDELWRGDPPDPEFKPSAAQQAYLAQEAFLAQQQEEK